MVNPYMRNEGARLVRQSNRVWNKVRSSAGESPDHIHMKEQICKLLNTLEYAYITEAIFETGGRADIYVPEKLTVIEIVHTEKRESIERKKEEYPPGLRMVVVETKR